ncbi:MAG: hypothetical protein M1818_004771 [Claussenomyces sp. TS43310]|nr:MAG: hypothetical protein M1818_004771 [Claussenomyces sp. TS43310]
MSQTTTAVEHELAEFAPISLHGAQPRASFDESTTAEAGQQPPPSQGRIFEAAQDPVGKYRELAITTFIISSNLVQFISNIIGIAAGLELAKSLGVKTGPGQANWIAASYPLTQGTFVLMSGRFGAVYGHKNILLAGGAWFVLWSLINGFCTNFIAFNTARAMTGIGGALIMPNAVALISTTVPPGRLRNVSLGFLAASAPIGGWLGALIAGGFLKAVGWPWIFYLMAILGACVFGPMPFLLPHERPVDRNGTIDWIGASLGTGGLILFNVVWNQAPAVGWSTPYEGALLAVALVLLSSFIFWEAKYAKAPILPLDIWKAPSFLPLVIVVLLNFMSFGTLLWYMVAWQQILRHQSVLLFSVGWTPFALFATLGALLAAWLIPRLAAQWMLAIGAGAVLVSNILLATMPEKQTYWAQVFPATILMSFCPDFVYTAAQIIASNSVKRHQQGIAASLIGTLNLYGNSLGLGFAGTVETEVNKRRPDPVLGYRAALIFGAGLAAIAIVLDVLFVRMVKDEREGWDPADEHAREDLVQASASRATGFQAAGS